MGGDGSVRPLDCLVVRETSALLLAACEPGTAPSQVRPPQDQYAVVAGLLGRLSIEPPLKDSRRRWPRYLARMGPVLHQIL
jgi:hypothetical protein